MRFFRGFLNALPISLALWGLIIAAAYAQTTGVPIEGAVVPRTTVNAAVVITTGNTFQTVLAANKAQQSLTVENNNASDSCWLFIGAGSAAKGTSILLLAGGSYTRYWPYIPSDALQATCASNSDTLYIDYQ